MQSTLHYTLYTKTIQEIAHNHNMIAHMYADDCQLYIALNKENQTNTENTIAECLSAIKRWMSESFLKLNAEKTQVKIFKSKSSETVSVPSLELCLSEYVSVLGVDLNDCFQFNAFIAKKVRSCQFHLRNFYNIKASLDVPTRIKLIYNQVLSCVDFCNVLLLGASDKDLRPLKLIINRAIRFVFSLGIRNHITPHYKHLGLLPIRKREYYF